MMNDIREFSRLEEQVDKGLSSHDSTNSDKLEIKDDMEDFEVTLDKSEDVTQIQKPSVQIVSMNYPTLDSTASAEKVVNEKKPRKGIYSHRKANVDIQYLQQTPV